ncbi:MAG: putative DNA binding domain-containing protein [Elusimicrobia bacterium]|nr:putative DNA binding domain-containing protein [Elusimicrobiota bacterium]
MTTPDRPLFSEAEVRALLERPEGQFLEFKSLWDRSVDPPRPVDRRSVRDTVAEYAAAFANADGGTLVLGVEDDGAPSGHRYPADAIEDIMAVPQRRLRPGLACPWQRITIDGHDVLLCQVPFAPEAVMVEANGFPYRTGDRVIREPQTVINQRKQAYRRVGYEARFRPEARIDDIDLDVARQFLSRTVYKDRSAEAALESYGLIVRKPDGLAVTNACLLLFGRAPMARWHPRAGLRFFRVSGKDRSHGTRRNVSQLGRIEFPLADAIPEAHRIAREHIRKSEKLHDLFFREMPEYPEFAWQEAIVNAFAHREYEEASREIEVWFYDDRMEVRSPGEPIPPVTLDLLRKRKPVHASRNPLLVRVLADAGLMREEGEGIPRIFEEMEESFLHEPKFRVESGEFSVTLRNEPVFVGADPEWRRIVQRLGLSTSQKRVLTAHPDGFTNADYQRLNKVDRDQAYQEIHEMVEQGVVRAAGSRGRGAVYRLAPDLHETRAFLSGRVSKLKAYLERRSEMRNADYRELFGVTRYGAVRELKRLVEMGYLVMTGERRGARYSASATLDFADS